MQNQLKRNYTTK